MAGLEMIEATDLYNLLNQGSTYPCLSDQNYLLLLDARKKHEYGESHIITAKKAPKNDDNEFVAPYDAELECKTHVVIYDGNTSDLKTAGAAAECANVMWRLGSRNPVKILKGGYEDFSALYPFLRTQKILYMPRELDDIKTYPCEIAPGQLYLGTLAHANSAHVQKELNIKGHVNCCQEEDTFFVEEGMFLKHIPVDDSVESDLLSSFPSACQFIDDHLERNCRVLVFSSLGISRSATVVISYLMHHYKWTLHTAYHHVLKCFSSARPNRGFISQLSAWEKQLFGENATDINDPNF